MQGHFMPICTLMLICGCQCLRLIPGFTVQPSRILLLSTYKAAMWISTLWSADGRWEKFYDRILIFTADSVSALKTSLVMCKDRSDLASILKKRVLQHSCNDMTKTLEFSKYSDDKMHVASAFCTIPTTIHRLHDKYLQKVFKKLSDGHILCCNRKRNVFVDSRPYTTRNGTEKSRSARKLVQLFEKYSMYALFKARCKHITTYR